MYSVESRANVCNKWRMWIDWIESDVSEFNRYCMDHYPEVLAVHTVDFNTRQLVFESEEHYHWFLLQQ